MNIYVLALVSDNKKVHYYFYPADDFITIDYKALNTNNAHIRLLKTDNSIDRTYPLDLQNIQKTINVADCNFGSYVMILVCDGINEDSEIVIIQ